MVIRQEPSDAIALLANIPDIGCADHPVLEQSVGSKT
jgi:hypothetical protein